MQYRRNYVEGGTYFFTVNLQDRGETLLVDHVDELRESVRWVKRRRPFYIDAWVVLPDHIHAVWTLPEGDADYSSRWREIKKRFSKALPQDELRSCVRERKGERGIWQRRFWEHTIRDDQDFRHHVDYVHYNPIKHGMVNQLKDWPFSSFHRYVVNGVYPTVGTVRRSEKPQAPSDIVGFTYLFGMVYSPWIGALFFVGFEMV